MWKLIVIASLITQLMALGLDIDGDLSIGGGGRSRGGGGGRGRGGFGANLDLGGDGIRVGANLPGVNGRFSVGGNGGAGGRVRGGGGAGVNFRGGAGVDVDAGVDAGAGSRRRQGGRRPDPRISTNARAASPPLEMISREQQCERSIDYLSALRSCIDKQAPQKKDGILEIATDYLSNILNPILQGDLEVGVNNALDGLIGGNGKKSNLQVAIGCGLGVAIKCSGKSAPKASAESMFKKGDSTCGPLVQKASKGELGMEYCSAETISILCEKGRQLDSEVKKSGLNLGVVGQSVKSAVDTAGKSASGLVDAAGRTANDITDSVGNRVLNGVAGAIDDTAAFASDAAGLVGNGLNIAANIGGGRGRYY